jgi:glycosyltransferase involved in cell wall biosynthesis
MARDQALVILIAPNVSEQMGGEAIKALQIFREMAKLYPDVIQITHARCKTELVGRLRLSNVQFIDDTKFSLIIWRSRVFRVFLNTWFAYQAIKAAEQIARDRNLAGDEVIVHQTEPNSPVTPRVISAHHVNVFGPINGNIYYPAIFRNSETWSARLRRFFHMPAQFINRCFFRDKQRVAAVLCAGGERTRASLDAAGYPRRAIFESIDCGVDDKLLDRRRVEHKGENLKFVHYGRLVFHKGTALIIESLPKTRHRVCLDVIGRGPELERCKKLAQDLDLSDRVRFFDWYPSHDDLLDALSQYRGVVLPSIEDANGIVVQEAMSLGIPAICLDWGGPQLLIEHNVCGFLIEPKSKEFILSGLAEYMDKLARDPMLAEKFSTAGRDLAQNWRWSSVARSWSAIYDRIRPLPD